MQGNLQRYSERDRTSGNGYIAVLPGSASKEVRVLRVEVSLETTGSAAIVEIALVRVSSALTGGTPNNMNIQPHDSNDPGASAVPISFAGAPSGGATPVNVRAVYVEDANSSSLPGANQRAWDWSTRSGKSQVLHGTAEGLAIYIVGSVNTQTALISYEWTEK